MKATKKRTFEPGDIVYVKRDMTWGTKPMKVICWANVVGYIKCKHPDCATHLFFMGHELEHDNPRRRRLAQNVIKAEKAFLKARKEAFGFGL